MILLRPPRPRPRITYSYLSLAILILLLATTTHAIPMQVQVQNPIERSSLTHSTETDTLLVGKTSSSSTTAPITADDDSTTASSSIPKSSHNNVKDDASESYSPTSQMRNLHIDIFNKMTQNVRKRRPKFVPSIPGEPTDSEKVMLMPTITAQYLSHIYAYYPEGLEEDTALLKKKYTELKYLMYLYRSSVEIIVRNVDRILLDIYRGPGEAKDSLLELMKIIQSRILMRVYRAVDECYKGKKGINIETISDLITFANSMLAWATTRVLEPALYEAMSVEDMMSQVNLFQKLMEEYDVGALEVPRYS